MGTHRTYRLRRRVLIERVVIPSAHVNALGLVLSIREMGWNGPIVCLKRKPAQAALTERFPSLCDTVYLPIDRVEDMALRLDERYPNQRLCVLLTDERFLGAFTHGGRVHTVRAAGALNALVCNKRQFYDFIQEHTMAAVPKSICSTKEPYAEFSGPFRTRVWSSWRGLARLPRGGLITQAAELKDWHRRVEELGLTPDEWGYQEQLSAEPQHNVSVCGWFDGSTHLAIVTRRRGVANGLGWWVERIDDPAYLIGAATRILGGLNYEGPYELEFVWDYRDACFRVIELNPRFWMQHRLINCLTDHSLVRRSLGMTCSVQHVKDGPRHWLQPDVLMTRPWKAIPAFNHAVLAYPMNGVAGALVRRQSQRLRRLVRLID